MRALWLVPLCFLGCEGQVGEFGDQGPVNVVIRDRSGPELVSFTCSATTVATRESFICSAEARHPTSQTLRCGLDTG